MQRAIGLFSNVLEGLGAIETNPIESTQYWEFYKAKYPTPAGVKSANYLSLAHDCPLAEASSKNLTRWKNLAGATSPYTLVVTKKSRHARDLSKTADHFKARTATTARQLLFDNVVSAFMPQTDQVEEGQYFIEPDIALTNTQTHPAVNFLVHSLLGAQSEQTGQVCADVVVAAAGLGKTTLARVVARKILTDSRRNAIPILVESAQWQNLINLTLPNILNAALLQIVPEAVRLTNSKLFQLLVQEQLLVPIFDGFDELCLHPHSTYTPAALLNELVDLVGDTGARVLITTRETFWETHAAGTASEKINRLNLQGFSNDQRKRFFTKRLKTLEERDIANRLSREVGERLYEGVVPKESHQADRASGVPLVLELIALYVDGNKSATFVPSTNDPVGPLLKAICERENARQQLNINADTQMKIFEELFRDLPDDISKSDLELYVEYSVPTVTKDALSRFESHAFFSPGNDVRARFESLKVYFVASWLANRLEAAIEEPASVNVIADLLDKNATGNTNVFDFLLERFVAMDQEKARAAISHALRMVQSRRPWEGAASALFHLAQKLALKLEHSRSGRAAKTLELLGATSPTRKLAVQGQISSLDLSGIVFENSVFRNVEFHKCVFDKTTEFRHTRFDGSLMFENCTGAGQVRLMDCALSEHAEHEWDLQAGRASKKIINETVVRDALREILRKFLGPFGFSTIKDANRNSGPILRSPCREEAWEELFKAEVLERHHISGVSAGGIHINNSSDVKHEIRNFLDNAALGQKLSQVAEGVLKRF